MQNIVKKNNPLYPSRLEKIKKSPENLFYDGVWDPSIFENCLAVVGSRTGTDYGKRITKKLVTEIASRGITIISGFMYGIDSYAHQACVDVGGRTIAILPYGIKKSPVDYQRHLYKSIIDNKGLIISEYPGDSSAQKWTFVERNRIVVGLAKAVLVVEGALSSGTMVTASLAQKYGRKLFAVGGHIDSNVSGGVNTLIKEGKAEMVTSAKDILSFFENQASSQDLSTPNITKRNLSTLEKSILKLIEIEGLSLDSLALKTGVGATPLGITLTTLALSGFIHEEKGKYYVS